MVVAGIDDDAVVAQDVLPAVPALEVGPVVAADEEDEFTVGVVVGQGLEGIPGVGGTGQVEFVVGGNDTRYVLNGFLGHLQA